MFDRKGAPSILLATNHLLGWTGSETLLLTLIQGLLERGSWLTVYTRHCDPEWLDSHFDSRVRLVSDLDSIREEHFDLAHIQHNSCLIDVRAAFPALPIVFSSLGVIPFLEQPPPFDVGVSRYLAISEEVAENLSRQGIARDKIHIVRNMVCGKEFFPETEIRKRPERILVLSYKMGKEKKNLLQKVAKTIGSSIRFAGGEGGVIPYDKMREAINGADIVVTLGRGAIETMMCGRIPLVFDVHGGDGLVTPDNLSDLWRCNFSGRRYARQYTAEDLVEEFGKYRQEYGSQLREMALGNFDTETGVARLMELYRPVLTEEVDTHLPEQMLPMLEFFSRMAKEDVRFAIRWENKFNNINNSISWRIAAPLRNSFSFFQKYFDSQRRKVE